MNKALLGLAVTAVAAAAGPRLPPGARDVSVVGFLADHKDSIMPMNSVPTVVGGFVNNGDLAYNISGIVGSLWAPDWSANYHNFSGVFIGEVVGGGDEHALEYRFRVPMLPRALEAKLLISVYYEDSQHRQFANSLFNGTVNFIEGKQPFDLRQYLPQALAVTLVAAALYVMRGLLAPEPAKAASVTESDAADEELVPSIRTGSSSSKAKARKSKGAEGEPVSNSKRA